jgi:hypothetical protein
MASRNILKLAVGFVGEAARGGLGRDLFGDRSIGLEESSVGGVRYRFARDLMCQRAAPDGTVWATRGYQLYRRDPGGDAFHLVERLPCPPTSAWLGRFRAVRQYVQRYDLADVVPLASGNLLVFSGGRIYRRAVGGPFREVHRLRRWGQGVGRGVRSQAIAQTSDGRVYYGEYFHNPADEAVRLWVSEDDGQSWRVAYEFPPGAARHVHAVQEDPCTGRLWVCTGDANDKSSVAYFTAGGAKLTSIGSGSQRWRTCKLLFTREAVFWATDTNLPAERGVVRWDRASGVTEMLCQTDGPSLSATRLAGGTWAVGTDREGLIGQQWFFASPADYHVTEPDNQPSLWLSHEGPWRRLKLWPWAPVGRWFGIPQIALGDGSPDLVLTCMHMSQHDGDLLIFAEQDLADWLSGPTNGTAERR